MKRKRKKTIHLEGRTEKVNTRRSWYGVKPYTRIHISKKIYQRTRQKKPERGEEE